MDFFAEIKKLTREHCEAMGYPVADCLKDAPSARWGVDLTIPPWLLKRQCSWCARQAEPDSDLCWDCYAKYCVPEPWKCE